MRSLLSINDISDEVETILNIATDFKEGRIEEEPLKNQKLAMIFQKSSTRTRVSFEVGMYELGGTALFLSNNDIQLGRGEPIKDTAKVLSIPVINGLTNYEHPCQALADMLTVKEHKGGFDGKFVYVGDGNNVCNSLMLICGCLGMDMAVACPDEYRPPAEIISQAEEYAAQNGSTITITADVKEAVKDADVIYTDVWVSMGDEAEEEKRMNDFAPYQVNQELVDLADDDVIFTTALTLRFMMKLKTGCMLKKLFYTIS